MAFYLFDSKSLPEGFRFPTTFLALLKQDALPNLYPWWFLCTSQLDADGRMLALRRLYPARQLVPFASWTGSDDLACFDGNCVSDDPVVHYVHVYASPGWEDRGHVPNFVEWLKVAEQESLEFKANE